MTRDEDRQHDAGQNGECVNGNERRLSTRLVDFASRHFIFAATVLALLVYVLNYMGHVYTPPIRSDGVGYYAYLPAYLIHGDPSFQELARVQYDGRIPEWTGITLCPATGRYLDQYGLGVALMMAPFFLAAHGVTWLFRYPAMAGDGYHFSYPLDGFSPFYQHAAGLAGLFYLIAGLFVLKIVLERYFSKGVVLGTLASLLLGTNLLFYGTVWSVMSHTYSFFLFSCLLYVIPRWYERPRSVVLSALFGLIVGLIALVRVPNVLVLLVFVLWGIGRLKDVKERARLFASHAATLSLAAGIACLVFLPQLLVWRYGAGRWLLNGYASLGGHFDFSSPAIRGVLFSLKKGLFFWSPILLLCLPGFWKLARSPARDLFVGGTVYLLFNVYVVSCWWCWWYGMSFGHRAFVESFAVAAFPLAAWYAGVRSNAGRFAVAVFGVLAVAGTLFLMKLFLSCEIGGNGLDAQALYDIVWARKEWLLNWLAR